MNNFVGIGRSVRDPEMRYIPSGTAVTNATMAIDKGLTKDKEAEFKAARKPTADFINIVAWGKTAEYLANHLKKGKLFAVQGSIQTGSYKDKDGKTVYTTDINAFRVKILEWADKQDDNIPVGFEEASNDEIPF